MLPPAEIEVPPVFPKQNEGVSTGSLPPWVLPVVVKRFTIWYVCGVPMSDWSHVVLYVARLDLN